MYHNKCYLIHIRRLHWCLRKHVLFIFFFLRVFVFLSKLMGTWGLVIVSVNCKRGFCQFNQFSYALLRYLVLLNSMVWLVFIICSDKGYFLTIYNLLPLSMSTCFVAHFRPCLEQSSTFSEKQNSTAAWHYFIFTPYQKIIFYPNKIQGSIRNTTGLSNNMQLWSSISWRKHETGSDKAERTYVGLCTLLNLVKLKYQLKFQNIT